MDRKLAIICSIVLASSFIIGILIGHYGINKSSLGSLVEDKFSDKEFVSDVLEKVDSDSIREFLKTLSAKPHIAASDRDRLIMKNPQLK